MARQPTRSIAAAEQKRVLNVLPDPPDIRDRYYEPALIGLAAEIDNRNASLVLDQGQEGACTGFGLAAAINILSVRQGRGGFRASTRMLYEMARKHDEWPGENYDGSSCRGAIRGWKNMGVCPDGTPKEATKDPAIWPYEADKDFGGLTVARARAARATALGAYYRLRPEISDYHAALNETGVIYASAQVTEGWSHVDAGEDGALPVIPAESAVQGGHAFAIVGYNQHGFIVQNSWGPGWGRDGFALWTYADWLAHIMDGWVFRLALSTPEIFGQVPRSAVTGGADAERRAPKRFEIAGHFAHFDDGRYKAHGDYWSTEDDVRNTARLFADDAATSGDYPHLLLYAHGGLNSPKASARRIQALKEGFKRNGIYPFHFMYDTGLAEAVKDAVRRARGQSDERAQGFFDSIGEAIADLTDTLIEDIVRKPVTAIWDEMKRDARLPFVKVDEATGAPVGAGLHTIAEFAAAIAGSGKKLHLAGHSNGSVLLGHLLDAIDTTGTPDLVSSCSLLAPACTVSFYKQRFFPRLGGAADGVARLPALDVYCLNDELERGDNVALAYRKSLLYLISRALERQKNIPLLGMAKYHDKVDSGPGLTVRISNGAGGVTASRTHGGFDNDAATMNSVMTRILGAAPPQPFTPAELKGF